MGKDDPILAYVEGLRDLSALRQGLIGQDLDLAKLEVFTEIATKIFPDDVLSRVSFSLECSFSTFWADRNVRQYMSKAMAAPTDLWLARKQMTLDYAGFVFMTYIFCLGQRTPSRLHISRATGCLHTTDVVTGKYSI